MVKYPREANWAAVHSPSAVGPVSSIAVAPWALRFENVCHRIPAEDYIILEMSYVVGAAVHVTAITVVTATSGTMVPICGYYSSAGAFGSTVLATPVSMPSGSSSPFVGSV